jgi:hypothetical protein
MLSSTTRCSIRPGPNPLAAAIPLFLAGSARLDTATPVVPARHVENFALDVFVAHQDLATGVRAKQTLDRICRQINLGPCLRINLWRFELLQDSILWREAVRNASRADILFFSLHGDRPLPAGLCHWLKHWLLLREERPCALVVSLDESQRNSESGRKILASLQDIAATGGIEVFPYFEPPQAAGSEPEKKRRSDQHNLRAISLETNRKPTDTHGDSPVVDGDSVAVAGAGECKPGSGDWGIDD